MTCTLTPRQAEGLELLGNGHLGVLLHGGTRSGKTFLFVLAIIARAMQYPGSRHLMARLHLAHARTSLWMETLIPLLRGVRGLTFNHSELHVTFPNASEIWTGGFDDKERIEKILGREFGTVFFNEVSQISYEAVTLGLTRLAQKIEGMRCVGYFDCNPPSPMHWAHKLFIEKVDPKSGKALERPELWGSLSMNPIDNLANLPENYMRDILDQLPERARRRLRDGEWVRSEGMIFNHFDPACVLDAVPDGVTFECYTIGIDFGLNMAGILVGWRGEEVWLLDEIRTYNATSSAFGAQIRSKWGHLRPHPFSYGDPSGGERLREVNAVPGNNSVESGLDFMSAKMEDGHWKVLRKCRGWLGEVYDYHKDEMGAVVKENNHSVDASRYAIFSHRSRGVILVGAGSTENTSRQGGGVIDREADRARRRMERERALTPDERSEVVA